MEDTKNCVVFCSAMNIYLGLSVGLSVYNKYILKLHKFPLFLLTCQFFFLFCISGALIYTLLKPKLSATPFWITKLSFSTYAYKLLPIGFLYGSDFIFTNIAIANGPLAFVQMIKSAIPLIVLFFKLFERDSQVITSSVIISVILLVCGQLLIFIHEVEFDYICFIASLCALLTSGTKLFVIEKLLKHNKKPTQITNDNNNNININNSYNDRDIMNEGENNAFIGLDSFSPAELMLTDSDDGQETYFYDVDIDSDRNTYKENVELQIVETNKKNRVKVISCPKLKNQNGKRNRLSFFRSILDKLSHADGSESHHNDIDHDEFKDNDNDGLNLIKKEKQKVSNFIDDIPLNQHQQMEQKYKLINSNIINNTNTNTNANNKKQKQKIHSMLALFYFMPVSWFVATFAFLVFEYPSIKRESVFVDSSEMISLLFEYLFSAIIAIALNWCELFMIGQWSALSFCIFSVFKLILIVGSSWLFFKHSFTFYSLCGYILCIVGVLCYNWNQIKNKPKVKQDIKQIFRAAYKSIKTLECFKHNKRKLYTKIWSEFPQNDNATQMYDYSDSSSDTLYG